ncbi:hypothetical protein HYV82_03850, partial [Candidatus Woesearchaeota archaeon]|nr:hypothetical protein [Candidatus Woesearchaeota archaeon]
MERMRYLKFWFVLLHCCAKLFIFGFAPNEVMTGYNYLIAYTNKLCYGHAVSAPVPFNDYVVDLLNGHAVSAPVSLLERTAIDTCDHSMWAEVFPLTPRQGKALAPEVPEG